MEVVHGAWRGVAFTVVQLTRSLRRVGRVAEDSCLVGLAALMFASRQDHLADHWQAIVLPHYFLLCGSFSSHN